MNNNLKNLMWLIVGIVFLAACAFISVRYSPSLSALLINPAIASEYVPTKDEVLRQRVCDHLIGNVKRAYKYSKKYRSVIGGRELVINLDATINTYIQATNSDICRQTETLFQILKAAEQELDPNLNDKKPNK